MLRNVTYLCPVLPHGAQWSGIKDIPSRVVEIRDELLTVSDMEGATVAIDRSGVFKDNTVKYSKMLKEMDAVTVELQRRGATLAEFYRSVGILHNFLSSNIENESSPFYCCKLGKK